jgi:hypothetical protein
MSRGNGGIMITSPDSTDLVATTTRRAKRETERGLRFRSAGPVPKGENSPRFQRCGRTYERESSPAERRAATEGSLTTDGHRWTRILQKDTEPTEGPEDGHKKAQKRMGRISSRPASKFGYRSARDGGQRHCGMCNPLATPSFSPLRLPSLAGLCKPRGLAYPPLKWWAIFKHP